MGMKYYGSKDRMTNEIREASPSNFKEYLELCGGGAAVARKVVGNKVPRTIVELDHGQAVMLQQIQKYPLEVAARLDELGYHRFVFEKAMEDKKENYKGCSDLEIAVERKNLTEMMYNSSTCTNYRDIDKGSDNDISCYIRAESARERYHRQLFPDCMNFSSELAGAKIIEGDMFDYLEKLNNPELFCFIDPPYRPKVRAAGKRGYDEDWSEGTHQRLMEELWGMYLRKELKAQIMICCYVNLEDMQRDLYCRYLLKMGFTLYLLKDVFLPKVCSQRVHSKKKQMNIECIFINYEPAGGDIVGPGRRFTFQDIYGSNEKCKL